MSFLRLEQLRKTYPDGTEAVKGIDLAIDEGEFVVLLGPSGCGKTTTLRMIAGLEIPTGGRVALAGDDVTMLRPARRDVGFVFQFYALYPHLSVRENIAFPLVSVGTPRREIAQRVGDVARRVGLIHLLDRSPRHLSGGDQQRVALARAMVRRPRVWLMDEPLGTLDAGRRAQMREFIRRQQLEMNVTTVYVTHDQEEALSLADRIVVMDRGVIRQVGTADDVYDKPADLFVANFVGSPGMNFIDGRIDERAQFLPSGAGPPLASSRSIRAGGAKLGVRCEHVHVDPAGPVEGTVIVNEFLGSCHLLHVDCPFGRVTARASASADGSVRLRLDPDHLNFFDPGSGARL